MCRLGPQGPVFEWTNVPLNCELCRVDRYPSLIKQPASTRDGLGLHYSQRGLVIGGPAAAWRLEPRTRAHPTLGVNTANLGRDTTNLVQRPPGAGPKDDVTRAPPPYGNTQTPDRPI